MESILPFTLQISLIIGVVVMYLYIIRKIKKSNVRIEDMVIWIVGGLVLIVFSLFPMIPSFFSEWIGFISPTNFIFALLIVLLLLVTFTQAIKLSLLQEKVKDLAHYHALFEFEMKQAHSSSTTSTSTQSTSQTPPLDCYTYYKEMYGDQ